LPPGPVASPGAASLAAAANPANVPYLYFVASADGHHEFRMTLEQHTDAVRQVRAAAPTKKVAPRMLAMAPAGKNSASKSTTTKASSTSKARVASKPTVKTASKTVKSSTAKKTPVKKTTRTATTKKRTSSRTTSTSK
ncbi:MAG TPA: endolytic transglycosylase MltG, partial [Gemmatimonadaceae bacterium]|nr:endolytic transglycosylase MltG [Gemmatimonadaceae bacterium]